MLLYNRSLLSHSVPDTTVVIKVSTPYIEKASSVQNYQEPSQMFDTDNFIFCSLNSETSKTNLQK